MSNLWASSYDYAVIPALSDTVDDPGGPFAGIYVAAGGTIVIWNKNGLAASAGPLTIAASAGAYLRWPIKRVGLSTTATVFGLVGAIVKQGT